MPFFDNVANELVFGFVPSVVIHARHFHASGVSTVMGKYAFSTDQFLCSISVKVGKMNGMGL